MSQPWQDRRFMGSSGKEKHEPTGRKSSISKIANPGGLSTLPAGQDGDHASRFMYKSSKEVHEPSVRKASMSSTKSNEGVPAAVTGGGGGAAAGAGGGGSTIANAIAGRRRSSASGQGGMFGGLMSTKGNDQHAQKREGWHDQKQGGAGVGGFFSGLMGGGANADKKPEPRAYDP